jgi:adenosylmethionine-8-amino-7-oxononanoate aminotransferase
MSDRSDGWRRRDRKVLLHPFTQHELWNEEDFPVIVSGEGVYLFDADGNKYLDGVSSLWLNVHGHRRPEIDEAIKKQLDKMAHSTFLGLSHPPGIELAEKLIEIAPEGLTRVFFSDDGSTAMEIALKMAYQYWTQQDPPQAVSDHHRPLAELLSLPPAGPGVRKRGKYPTHSGTSDHYGPR